MLRRTAARRPLRFSAAAADVPSAPRSVTTSGQDDLARAGYALHGGELYRFALSRLRDEGLAQDAVQETIVRAWRAADRFDPGLGSLRTWLFAILRNVVTDQLATDARTPQVLHDPQAEAAVRDDAVMRDQSDTVADADLVRRALGTVSDDHRHAIVETYLRDRPYDEVAAELGLSVSTLRSRVFHGLRHLRTAMTTMEEQ